MNVAITLAIPCIASAVAVWRVELARLYADKPQPRHVRVGGPPTWKELE